MKCYQKLSIVLRNNQITYSDRFLENRSLLLLFLKGSSDQDCMALDWVMTRRHYRYPAEQFPVGAARLYVSQCCLRGQSTSAELPTG